MPTASTIDAPRPRVTVLAGGVGGAKLAHGMARAGADLTVVVNTGDDTCLHGLAISPDLDTVTYTLAGIVNPATGWGLADETFHALDAMRRLGEDTWFQLGDRDLATHIVRTARLRAGATLSTVTADIATHLGIEARVLPMTDDPVATLVDTPEGRLGFQEYFVGRRHDIPVTGLTYDGADRAQPAPGVLAAIASADLVVLAPSNPLLSIAPVLAVPGIRDALAATGARRVAVSPIIGGRALKGPAAAVLDSLGHEVSAVGVARIYQGLIDTMCLDDRDTDLASALESLGLTADVTDTLMPDADARERLARHLLQPLG